MKGEISQQSMDEAYVSADFGIQNAWMSFMKRFLTPSQKEVEWTPPEVVDTPEAEMGLGGKDG